MAIIVVEKSNLNTTFNFSITWKTKQKLLRGAKKTIIASQRRYEYIKANKLIISIEGSISKNVINTHMKGINIPRLWRSIFTKIANNSDYVYNYCNRPYNSFHRHCHEWYFYILLKKNTELNYDIDVNYGMFPGNVNDDDID